MTTEQHTPSLISVIVPCYRQAQELAGCLDSLVPQSAAFPCEIIVVDSGNDPEVRAVCKQYPGVKALSPGDRLFCGPAKNYGAEAASANWLAFTDADCRPAGDWIEKAVQVMRSGAVLAGGPVLDALPLHPIAVSDNLLQFSDVPPGRPAGKIEHVPGCNLIITKAAFEAAGGFGMGNSGDDVKLTNEVKNRFPQGIDFFPLVKVKHLGRKTLADYFRHHHTFGYVRGKLKLHLSDRQQHLGSLWLMLPMVVLKRFAYIVQQAVKYQPARVGKILLLAPILLPGLTAYALGFRSGCAQAISEQ